MDVDPLIENAVMVILIGGRICKIGFAICLKEDTSGLTRCGKDAACDRASQEKTRSGWIQMKGERQHRSCERPLQTWASMLVIDEQAA